MNEKPARFTEEVLAVLAVPTSPDGFEGVLSFAIASTLGPMVSVFLLAATEESLDEELQGMARVGGFSQDADPRPIAGPEVQPV